MRILFIGNHFLAENINVNVWQELPVRLMEQGFQTLITSPHQKKITRLFDMVWTILTKQEDYQLAEIDLFSGPAFIWAEISVFCVKLIIKPFILTLHGGNLPEFSRHFPQRVRSVLTSAKCVISPSPYLASQLKSFRSDIRVIPNPISIDQFIG